MVCLINAN